MKHIIFLSLPPIGAAPSVLHHLEAPLAEYGTPRGEDAGATSVMLGDRELAIYTSNNFR